MNTYSIARIDGGYVVLADDKRILKVASRRKAAKLVVDAAELLSEQSLLASERGPCGASIACEPRKLP